MSNKNVQYDESPKPNRSAQPLDVRLTDRLWRLENLYFIKNKQGAVIRFKLKASQRRLLSNLHSRNILLKARQLGMSTFIAVLFLDECLFKQNVSAAIVADKIENGKNIFKKIDFAWTQFPAPLKAALGLESSSDSSSEMSWSNGSSIKVGTTLHSGTYQCLHISEYGPMCAQSPEKADDIKKSALPTVPADGGLVFIESTAEGEGNDFHQMCMDAMELEQKLRIPNSNGGKRELFPTEYKFFFFPWYEEAEYRIKGNVEIPRRLVLYFDELQKSQGITLDIEQKNWYTLTEKDLKHRMKEQHPSTKEEAFLSSGNKQFNPEILERKMREEVREPEFVDGDFVIYSQYKRGHAYGIGADVGDGVGLDSSTACVIDFTENAVAATYKSSTIDPINFAFDLARIGTVYGGAIIAPENNRTGAATCSKLHEIYSNVYQQEIMGHIERKMTTRIGWATNAATKPRMMSELKAAIEADDDSLAIPDPTILREARMYAKEDNLIIASATQLLKTTKHFDLLIATAIAWQMRHHANISLEDPKAVHRVGRLRSRALAGERRFR